jgi:hypothetical protein
VSEYLTALREELLAGFTDQEWAVGRVLCPAGEKCAMGTPMPYLFVPMKTGRLPMHRGWLGEPCPGAHQKPTTPPLQIRPTHPEGTRP